MEPITRRGALTLGGLGLADVVIGQYRAGAVGKGVRSATGVAQRERLAAGAT